MASAVIERVVLRNYRSIRSCDVELGPLTFLVGPNGSGKSNFLDALRFVSEALTNSLDHALRERNGITSVRRWGADREPAPVGIRIDLTLGEDSQASYAFEIVSTSRGRFAVEREECTIESRDGVRR